MPELNWALLSDHTRLELSGVAHILAAGIDTVTAPAVPATQSIGIVASIAFTRNECGRLHSLEMLFQGEDGQSLAKIKGTTTPEYDESLPPGWHMNTLVAFNLPLPLPAYGNYSVEILIDDQTKQSLRLRVRPPAEGP